MEKKAVTTFEIRVIFKDAEEDSFDNGCLSGTYQSAVIDQVLAGDTVAELLHKFAAFLGAGIGEINADPCGDDPSRIEICRNENSEGFEPSAEHVAEWKAGRARLWFVTYTAYIEEVTRTPANVTGAEV